MITKSARLFMNRRRIIAIHGEGYIEMKVRLLGAVADMWMHNAINRLKNKGYW